MAIKFNKQLHNEALNFPVMFPSQGCVKNVSGEYTDFDDMPQGLYRCDTLSGHKPASGTQYCVLTIFYTMTGNYKYQFAITHGAGGTSNEGLFFRYRVADTWLQWKKVNTT